MLLLVPQFLISHTFLFSFYFSSAGTMLRSRSAATAPSSGVPSLPPNNGNGQQQARATQLQLQQEQEEEEEQPAVGPAAQHVFCYGSLRPDDDSGMPWTAPALDGTRAQRACVAGARLYKDKYACLVLANSDDDHNNNNNNNDKEEDETARAATVQGWILTTENPDQFADKLKSFDSIEGYDPDDVTNSWYQRAVVDAYLKDPSDAINEPIGPMNGVIKAFVYHRPDCKKDEPIVSGDWLRRNRDNE